MQKNNNNANLPLYAVDRYRYRRKQKPDQMQTKIACITRVCNEITYGISLIHLAEADIELKERNSHCFPLLTSQNVGYWGI